MENKRNLEDDICCPSSLAPVENFDELDEDCKECAIKHYCCVANCDIPSSHKAWWCEKEQEIFKKKIENGIENKIDNQTFKKLHDLLSYETTLEEDRTRTR